MVAYVQFQDEVLGVSSADKGRLQELDRMSTAKRTGILLALQGCTFFFLLLVLHFVVRLGFDFLLTFFWIWYSGCSYGPRRRGVLVRKMERA